MPGLEGYGPPRQLDCRVVPMILVVLFLARPEAEGVTKVDRITRRKPVRIETPRQPNGILLRKPPRQWIILAVSHVAKARAVPLPVEQGSMPVVMRQSPVAVGG